MDSGDNCLFLFFFFTFFKRDICEKDNGKDELKNDGTQSS